VGLAAGHQHPGAEAGAAGVFAREDAIAAGRACRGGDIELRAADGLRGQAV